jgi:quercetin dioxygenase-like cupin family protein
MKILRFTPEHESPIEGRPYETVGAFTTPLGHGQGDGRTSVVRFEPGGRIGSHLTGFGQLLIVVEGSGWVEQDGHRVSIERHEAAHFPRGVMHSKGSDAGMTAVMVQLLDLETGPPDDD